MQPRPWRMPHPTMRVLVKVAKLFSAERRRLAPDSVDFDMSARFWIWHRYPVKYFLVVLGEELRFLRRRRRRNHQVRIHLLHHRTGKQLLLYQRPQSSPQSNQIHVPIRNVSPFGHLRANNKPGFFQFWNCKLWDSLLWNCLTRNALFEIVLFWNGKTFFIWINLGTVAETPSHGPTFAQSDFSVKVMRHKKKINSCGKLWQGAGGRSHPSEGRVGHRRVLFDHDTRRSVVSKMSCKWCSLCLP